MRFVMLSIIWPGKRRLDPDLDCDDDWDDSNRAPFLVRTVTHLIRAAAVAVVVFAAAAGPRQLCSRACRVLLLMSAAMVVEMVWREKGKK